MTGWPQKVKLVEVGPRDGLQNEPEQISTADKVTYIQKLQASGLQHIEATSFVHPKAVPQLADAAEVLQQLSKISQTTYSVLVPNQKGLERALESGVKRIAVFTAASDAFTQKNIRMTVEESIATFQPVVQQALEHGLSVRGYVSTCFVCPYQGDIDKNSVLKVTEQLLELGVDEISLGDTIGAASPKDVYETIGYVLQSIPTQKLALHFHDTYGTALANVLAGLELGIATYDSSAGGLGGCPYAPGASGNLATEDLLYMLNRMKIHTGVNIDKVADASLLMESVLKRPLPSKQLQRIKAARETEILSCYDH